jgi:hypothetical protein
MEIAMQQKVEARTELTQLMTQNLINRDSKSLPPGMQQLLDEHSQIVQMVSQITASTNDNLPQNDHGGKEPRDGAEITLQACKIYGEIGHMSEECREQCLTVIRTIHLRNVPWPRLLVSYAVISTMYLLNVSFTPQCNK